MNPLMNALINALENTLRILWEYSKIVLRMRALDKLEPSIGGDIKIQNWWFSNEDSHI